MAWTMKRKYLFSVFLSTDFSFYVCVHEYLLLELLCTIFLLPFLSESVTH